MISGSKFERVWFDPKNVDHLRSYDSFLKEGNWSKSKHLFRLEWPYSDIVNMIKDKIIETHLETLIKKSK